MEEQLEELRKIGRDEAGARGIVIERLRDHDVVPGIADALLPALAQLAATEVATPTELHEKFRDSGFTLQYSDTSTFFKGLGGIIGDPRPNVEPAMRDEHCNDADADVPFTTGNYQMETTSKIECERARA